MLYLILTNSVHGTENVKLTSNYIDYNDVRHAHHFFRRPVGMFILHFGLFSFIAQSTRHSLQKDVKFDFDINDL